MSKEIDKIKNSKILKNFLLNNFFENFVPVFNKWCVSIRFNDNSEFKLNKEKKTLKKLKKKNFDLEKIILISDIPTKIDLTRNLDKRKNSFFSDFENFETKKSQKILLLEKEKGSIFDLNEKTNNFYEKLSLKSQSSQFDIENISYSSDEYDSIYFSKNDFGNFEEPKLYRINKYDCFDNSTNLMKINYSNTFSNNMDFF